MECDDEICHEDVCSHRIISGGLFPSFIQISASNSEMKQRIAALIEGKREKVNKRNELEFINEEKGLNSCARASATLKCKRGMKSHVDVCRVWNAWGPQTAVNIKSNPKNCDCVDCVTKQDEQCNKVGLNSCSTSEAEILQQQFNPVSSVDLKESDVKVEAEIRGLLKKRYAIEEIESKINKLEKRIKLKSNTED